MKKKCLYVASGVLALAVIIAILWLWSDALAAPRTRLASENFPMIKNGMTLAEVENLLGGPAGNFGRHANGGSKMTMEGYIGPVGTKELIWCDDSNRFEIYFDAQDRVVGFHRRAGYAQSPPESILVWLRRQLGL